MVTLTSQIDRSEKTDMSCAVCLILDTISIFKITLELKEILEFCYQGSETLCYTDTMHTILIFL